MYEDEEVEDVLDPNLQPNDKPNPPAFFLIYFFFFAFLPMSVFWFFYFFYFLCVCVFLVPPLKTYFFLL